MKKKIDIYLLDKLIKKNWYLMEMNKSFKNIYSGWKILKNIEKKREKKRVDK